MRAKAGADPRQLIVIESLRYYPICYDVEYELDETEKENPDEEAKKYVRELFAKIYSSDPSIVSKALEDLLEPVSKLQLDIDRRDVHRIFEMATERETMVGENAQNVMVELAGNSGVAETLTLGDNEKLPIFVRILNDFPDDWAIRTIGNYVVHCSDYRNEVIDWGGIYKIQEDCMRIGQTISYSTVCVYLMKLLRDPYIVMTEEEQEEVDTDRLSQVQEFTNFIFSIARNCVIEHTFFRMALMVLTTVGLAPEQLEIVIAAIEENRADQPNVWFKCALWFLYNLFDDNCYSRYCEFINMPRVWNLMLDIANDHLDNERVMSLCAQNILLLTKVSGGMCVQAGFVPPILNLVEQSGYANKAILVSCIAGLMLNCTQEHYTMMLEVGAGATLLGNVGGIDPGFNWFRLVVMGVYQYIDKLKFFDHIDVDEEVLENNELRTWIETFPSLTQQDCDEETYRHCQLLWNLVHTMEKEKAAG